MKPITKQQRRALYDLYKNSLYSKQVTTYRAFRKTAQLDCLGGCLLISVCGMCIGIERDGYTHS